MKTIFAQPSNTYTIVLTNHDLAKLVLDGSLLYQPLHTANTYMNMPGKVTNTNSHYLQYHGPEAGTIPVQFVSICVKREE